MTKTILAPALRDAALQLGIELPMPQGRALLPDLRSAALLVRTQRLPQLATDECDPPNAPALLARALAAEAEVARLKEQRRRRIALDDATRDAGYRHYGDGHATPIISLIGVSLTAKRPWKLW